MTDIPRVVYATWGLADLDWLHDEAGLGSEWRASGRRAEMVEAMTSEESA